jgi:protein-disulfide isomerase
MIKNSLSILASILIAFGGMAAAQATKSAEPQAPAPPPAPLELHGITPPQKIQFPPANPKDFTAQSPTTEEVNAFLKQLWGYDPNRVWQVDGIQSTKAANISRVTVLVAEQGVSHTPATTVFFVTPDGQHAIAGTEVIAFGAHPFATIRQKLEQQATGPYRGSSSKDLMLVEFADLQCPHCKEAASTMDHLATDFPNARIVFQNFPLTNVHPAAEKAAEYGVCVAEEKGNAAFFQYVQAVFDTQAALTTNADETLNNAATKAGANAAAVGACATGPAAKAAVTSSVKLGQEIGVDETPLLFINGRPIPVGGVPYNTIKQIVAYEVPESGSTAASATANK